MTTFKWMDCLIWQKPSVWGEKNNGPHLPVAQSRLSEIPWSVLLAPIHQCLASAPLWGIMTMALWKWDPLCNTTVNHQQGPNTTSLPVAKPWEPNLPIIASSSGSPWEGIWPPRKEDAVALNIALFAWKAKGLEKTWRNLSEQRRNLPSWTSCLKISCLGLPSIFAQVNTRSTFWLSSFIHSFRLS